MVERYRRQKGKQKLLGNHQKCWIWGKNVVLETLRAGKWPILELRLAETLEESALDETRTLADSREVKIVVVESADSLETRCRSGEHQGYLAKMPPFPYDDALELLDRHRGAPLYVVLDAIQDPYNFGAVIRSADAMGVDAIFVSEHSQVDVTSLVARTSAGAVSNVPIAQVPDLPDMIRRLRSLRIAVYGASEKASIDLSECDFTQPSAIVIGNEGTGISDDVSALCDRLISIPQCGSVDSLNAAVSAGILFYEARRQRTAHGMSNKI